MNQYEEFFKKIKEYFAYDEVVSEGGIINAYDLINILKEKTKELYSLIHDNEHLIDLIEEFYTYQETYGIFLKKKRNVSLAKVDFILQKIEQEHSEFYVRLKDVNYEKLGYKELSICKDNGEEELYFDQYSGKDKEFVEHFQELILARFEKLEEFYNLFKLNDPNINELPSNYCFEDIISDDFLKIVISYDTYGRFVYTIGLEKAIDPDNLFNREWLNHDSLRKYVSTHKEELLRRIAVNILSLKPSTQKIITDYYSKNNKEEKQLKL